MKEESEEEEDEEENLLQLLFISLIIKMSLNLTVTCDAVIYYKVKLADTVNIVNCNYMQLSAIA